MKVYYARYDEQGNYIAFYPSDLNSGKNPERISEPKITLNEEQYRQAVAGNNTTGIFKVINGIHTHIPYTQEELDARDLIKVRAKRNELLKESDWTQMPDIPFSEAKLQEWKDYRQALRDITNSKPYVFPTKPE